MRSLLLGSVFSASLLTLFACGSPRDRSDRVDDRFEALIDDINLNDPGAFQPFSSRSSSSGREVDFFESSSEGDPILKWNYVLLDANAIDHGLEEPDQGGPVRTARAFAIVHIAMFEALNAVAHFAEPYLDLSSRGDVDQRVAVAAAAHKTLVQLYPQQKSRFDDALRDSLRPLNYSDESYRGFALGRYSAGMILNQRERDGASVRGVYRPRSEIGFHQLDPLNPNQGFLDPAWGSVRPFVLPQRSSIGAAPPPPPLDSAAYADAYEEVRRLGGDGRTTPTERNEEETEIGIYWAYDGRPGLGTPPRLYNQIVREVAVQECNSPYDNALLFLGVNVAMADAGIVTWKTKYDYEFWRPIVGIRAGQRDRNERTRGDSRWSPLGSPASNGNGSGGNFTPNFPAYTSGHATFGEAAFRTLTRFFDRDRIPFSFISDEFNGRTVDQNGRVRPIRRRSFESFTQASEENGQSRIYLGVHWSFDSVEGRRSGREIADYISERLFQNRN